MAKKKRTAKQVRRPRVAPFVPSAVALGKRDIVNQVLNDATWTVVTPDWAKWVKTNEDGSWVSNPAVFTNPTIKQGSARAKKK
jgi:hypothetical protein